MAIKLALTDSDALEESPSVSPSVSQKPFTCAESMSATRILTIWYI